MANPFDGLDASTLSTLKTQYLACLTAIAQNQAYSLNGRSLTRANLSEVKTTLGQIQAALDLANGTTTNTTRVNFTGYGGTW